MRFDSPNLGYRPLGEIAGKYGGFRYQASLKHWVASVAPEGGEYRAVAPACAFRGT